MKLDEVFEHKDAIAHAVGDKITHSMADFGWRILQSLVINVDPDQSVKTAMNTLQASSHPSRTLPSPLLCSAENVAQVHIHVQPGQFSRAARTRGPQARENDLVATIKNVH